MKKIAVLVLAFVALLAVGGVVANAAKNRFVNSTVSIKFNGGNDPYYEQAEFKGKIKGKGSGNAAKRCTRKRQIRIINKATGDVVGRDQTNRKGKYSTGVDNSFVGGDKYFAKARQRRFTNHRQGRGGRTTVICRRKNSKVIKAG